MKKLLVVFLIIFFSVLPCFAQYKPIPKELSSQYKAEMEQIIDNGYPIAIKNVDEYFLEANKYYQEILKGGYNYINHVNIVNLSEICIPAAELELYADLMKVTQEKYLNITYKGIGTDNINPFYDYLYPYFSANNVNTEKLKAITKYEKEKIQILKTYIEEIEKLSSN